MLPCRIVIISPFRPPDGRPVGMSIHGSDSPPPGHPYSWPALPKRPHKANTILSILLFFILTLYYMNIKVHKGFAS